MVIFGTVTEKEKDPLVRGDRIEINWCKNELDEEQTCLADELKVNWCLEDMMCIDFFRVRLQEYILNELLPQRARLKQVKDVFEVEIQSADGIECTTLGAHTNITSSTPGLCSRPIKEGSEIVAIHGKMIQGKSYTEVREIMENMTGPMILRLKVSEPSLEKLQNLNLSSFKMSNSPRKEERTVTRTIQVQKGRATINFPCEKGLIILEAKEILNGDHIPWQWQIGEGQAFAETAECRIAKWDRVEVYYRPHKVEEDDDEVMIDDPPKGYTYETCLEYKRSHNRLEDLDVKFGHFHFYLPDGLPLGKRLYDIIQCWKAYKKWLRSTIKKKRYTAEHGHEMPSLFAFGEMVIEFDLLDFQLVDNDHEIEKRVHEWLLYRDVNTPKREYYEKMRRKYCYGRDDGGPTKTQKEGDKMILILELVKLFKDYHQYLFNMRAEDMKISLTLCKNMEFNSYELGDIVSFTKERDSFDDGETYFEQFGFSEIWMRHLEFCGKNLSVCYRDVPMPILSTPSIALSGPFSYATLNCPEKFIQLREIKPFEWIPIMLANSSVSPKVFLEWTCTLADESIIAYGRILETVNQAVTKAIQRIIPSSGRSKYSLRWWDDFRFRMHGTFDLRSKGLDINLLVGKFDMPYFMRFEMKHVQISIKAGETKLYANDYSLWCVTDEPGVVRTNMEGMVDREGNKGLKFAAFNKLRLESSYTWSCKGNYNNTDHYIHHSYWLNHPEYSDRKWSEDVDLYDLFRGEWVWPKMMLYARTSQKEERNGLHVSMWLSCRKFLQAFMDSFTMAEDEEIRNNDEYKGLTEFFRPMRIDLLVEDPIVEIFDIWPEEQVCSDTESDDQEIEYKPFGCSFAGRFVWFRCVINENPETERFEMIKVLVKWEKARWHLLVNNPDRRADRELLEAAEIAENYACSPFHNFNKYLRGSRVKPQLWPKTTIRKIAECEHVGYTNLGYQITQKIFENVTLDNKQEPVRDDALSKPKRTLSRPNLLSQDSVSRMFEVLGTQDMQQTSTQDLTLLANSWSSQLNLDEVFNISDASSPERPRVLVRDWDVRRQSTDFMQLRREEHELLNSPSPKKSEVLIPLPNSPTTPIGDQAADAIIPNHPSLNRYVSAHSCLKEDEEKQEQDEIYPYYELKELKVHWSAKITSNLKRCNEALWEDETVDDSELDMQTFGESGHLPTVRTDRGRSLIQQLSTRSDSSMDDINNIIDFSDSDSDREVETDDHAEWENPQMTVSSAKVFTNPKLSVNRRAGVRVSPSVQEIFDSSGHVPAQEHRERGKTFAFVKPLRKEEKKRRKWLVRLTHSQVKFLRDGQQYCILMGAPDAFVQSFGFPVSELPRYEEMAKQLKRSEKADEHVFHKARIAATLIDAQIFVSPMTKFQYAEETNEVYIPKTRLQSIAEELEQDMEKQDMIDARDVDITVHFLEGMGLTQMYDLQQSEPSVFERLKNPIIHPHIQQLLKTYFNARVNAAPTSRRLRQVLDRCRLYFSYTYDNEVKYRVPWKRCAIEDTTMDVNEHDSSGFGGWNAHKKLKDAKLQWSSKETFGNPKMNKTRKELTSSTKLYLPSFYSSMDSAAFHNMFQVTSSLLLGDSETVQKQEEEEADAPKDYPVETMLEFCKEFAQDMSGKKISRPLWKVEYQADTIFWKMLRAYTSESFVETTLKAIRGVHCSFTDNSMVSEFELGDLVVKEPALPSLELEDSSNLRIPSSSNSSNRRSWTPKGSRLSHDFDLPEVTDRILISPNRNLNEEGALIYLVAETIPTPPHLTQLTTGYKLLRLKSQPISIELPEPERQGMALYDFFVRSSGSSEKRVAFYEKAGIDVIHSPKPSRISSNQDVSSSSSDPASNQEFYNWFRRVHFETVDLSLTLTYWNISVKDFRIHIDRFVEVEKIQTWRELAESLKSHCIKEVVNFKTVMGRAAKGDDGLKVKDMSSKQKECLARLIQQGSPIFPAELEKFYVGGANIEIPHLKTSPQQCTVSDIIKFGILCENLKFVPRFTKLSTEYSETGSWTSLNGRMRGTYEILWTLTKTGPQIKNHYFQNATPDDCVAIIKLEFDKKPFHGSEEDTQIFQTVHGKILWDLQEYFMKPEFDLKPLLILKNYWNDRFVEVYVCFGASCSWEKLSRCLDAIQNSVENASLSAQYRMLGRALSCSYEYAISNVSYADFPSVTVSSEDEEPERRNGRDRESPI